ncbi:MAG: hypothetical protein AcusKO_34820 [Acuticoccus sp.]
MTRGEIGPDAGRILWHYSVLNLGGAELSTIRLLEGLGRRGLAPLLALNLPGGTAEPRLGGAIEVKHLRPSAVPRPQRDGRGAVRYVAARCAQQIAAMRLRAGAPFAAAVVGLQGLSPRLVLGVPAARRLHFIRSDLGACDPDGRIVRAIRASQSRIDAYVCVSEAARRALLDKVPGLAGKTHTIANLLDPFAIRAGAAGPSPFAPSPRLKVVTVARLVDRAKGLMRMVRVHRALLAAGLSVDWFVIGDGPDRAALERAVASAGLAGRMHLLGARANPLPFVRAADLVAVLSCFEGLSGVINEAKVLRRAVIATDVGGAREQLGNGGGLVVPSCERAIAEGMAGLLRDAPWRERLAATPLPAALLDDEAKLDRLIGLLLPTAAPAQGAIAC